MPAPIDAYCTVGSYWDHLAPIWLALPDEARGTLYTRPGFSSALDPIPHTVAHPPRSPNLTLVASYIEETLMRRIGRPVVYIEHGAGQTYTEAGERNPSYSGGTDHDAVAYICPNETVAARWRKYYPQAAVYVVGCPKMDQWVDHVSNSGGPVAISFHHNSPTCPESRWAFPAWSKYLQNLSSHFELLGHGHPRAYRRLSRFWDAIGVPHTPDFTNILHQASVFVIDNSSAALEAAWAGLPVILLNASHYRRNVHHGGRFWEWPMPMVDTLDELVAVLQNPPEPAQGYAETILGPQDGKATQRAVEAVLAVWGSVG